MKASAFTYKMIVVVCLLLGLVLVKLASSDLETRYAYDKLAMLARFGAKEYCTCRFVSERTPTECESYIDAYLPIFGKRLQTSWITKISENKNQVVSQTLLFVSAKATFSPANGCLLESKLNLKPRSE
jgi:hypothetical protein